MGNILSLQFGLEDSFLFFMWEAYRTIYNGTEEHRHGRRRSLIRLIGWSLPNRIKRAQRVTIHPTARRSMFKPTSCYKSRLVAEYSLMDSDVNQLSVMHAQPDVVPDLYPIFEKEKTPKRCTLESKKESEEMAVIVKQLNELHCVVQQLLAASNMNRETAEPPVALLPPPPPPPPPLPMFSAVMPQLKITKKDKTIIPKTDPPPLSMCDVLKDMKKVKLRHVERSPGGRPTRRPKTPTQPADSLAEILKRRFAAIQLSPEVLNGTDSDDSDSYKIHLVPKELNVCC